MDLSEFKRRVREAFGQDLENATPANVPEFVATLYQEMWKAEREKERSRTGNPKPPLDLNFLDSANSYEESVRQFFARVLDEPNEQALLFLWLYALDLAYAGIEQLQSEEFNSLFGDESINE